MTKGGKHLFDNLMDRQRRHDEDLSQNVIISNQKVQEKVPDHSMSEDEDDKPLSYYDTVQAVHYDFRFTWTEQDEKFQYEDEKPRWRSITKRLVEELLRLYTITQLTCGMEYMSKRGEQCRAHIHIRFDTKATGPAIIRKIKRFLQKYGQQTCGNKAFRFKPAVVRNFDEFYRYPLKQNLDYKLCYGLTKDRLLHLHEVGKDSYSKTVEINQAKMDKMDSSDTMFQRLCIVLDKTLVTQKIPLIIEALKFYVKERKPINRQTISGYIDTYMLMKGYISYEDYANKYFN